jgi:hypothetical protein
MVTKVIYIGYQPLTQKVKEDFYFDIVLENGFEVGYWDLSPIYFPNILKDNLSEEYISKISTFSELERLIALQNNEICIYILHITYEYRVIKLFRLLTQYNCKTSFFARGALPICGDISSNKVKIMKALNPMLLLNFIKNKYATYLKLIGRIKFYDLVFSAGELGYLSIGCGSQIDKLNSKFININSTDFDTFFDNVTVKKSIKKKYCLFLDEYLPHHPDFILLGIKAVPADVYYSTLNDFFKIIEEKYNLEVVIAAHPKALGYKKQNPFNGRDVFFNDTARLTKFSEFTLTHLSTSQSFSVLNNKPILSLTSDCLKNVMPQYNRFISYMSDVLGSSFVNVDHFLINELNVSNTDNLKYEDYKYKYLTSAISEKENSPDIFIKTISQL